MVIITAYLIRHELKPLKRHIKIVDILNGCKKILKNLAQEIRLPGMPDDFRFFKVRVGQRDKGRMIVYMITENKKIIPILIRLKKDKVFGMNMSANNVAVVNQITKNIDHILLNIRQKEYEELEI